MELPQVPVEFMAAPRDQVMRRALDYLESVFDKRYEGDEDEALKALPEPLADYWVLQWLDYEVIQGGLETYFINSHGRQAKHAIEALRRLGADDIADCLEDARKIAVKHEAAWSKRNQDLDALGEYAIARPFQDLDGVNEMRPVRERFDHLWFDRKPYWGELMDDCLERFRQQLSDAK